MITHMGSQEEGLRCSTRVYTMCHVHMLQIHGIFDIDVLVICFLLPYVPLPYMLVPHTPRWALAAAEDVSIEEGEQCNEMYVIYD